MRTKVDVGVPCYGSQHHEWWVQVMTDLHTQEKAGLIEVGAVRAVGSALPDHNKNTITDDRRGAGNRWALEPHRPAITDVNRSAITAGPVTDPRKSGFLSGDAEWLWMLDDDIVPPDGTVSHLMGLGHAFVGAACFLGQPPYNLTAYFLDKDGFYRTSVLDFSLGLIIPVDSIGMGCTLIHRSVFEKIIEAHEVWVRPTGSLMPIPKRLIKNRQLPGNGREGRLENGYYHMPVTPVSPDDNRPWPFFAMEYVRTEDHHFCELAREAGVRPMLDTAVLTEHLKTKPIGRDEQIKALEDYGIRG